MKQRLFSSPKLVVIKLTLLSTMAFAEAPNPKCLEMSKQKTFDVNIVMDSPECIKGQIEIRGTVNTVSGKKNGLMLIDLSEKDNCEDGCAIKRMPVVWTGKMPSKGDSIIASGKLKRTDSKFVFAADSLKLISKKD